ncbi:Deoxyribonuclease II [Strongyloides ratti]|uniref:Deoxyribonuclease II n=1 Tax=Strongyloides ratti TaxID=34506 RepID=A0A090KUQ2_STRRB|nr:Deoxyribonuclease II [Strongyloides ratti]CEF59600.1 Deoxyribonuclease II [Strongyloides ratti]
MIPIKLIVGFILATITTIECLFTCKDQNNNPVDYWLAYKLPKNKKDKTTPGVRDGYAYYYLDAKNPSFSVSKNPLNSENQAFGYTLNQFYKEPNRFSLAYFMWNDDLPKSVHEARESNHVEKDDDKKKNDANSKKYGHTKGVLFSDKKSGVYLIHSVPRFPDPLNYTFPESGRIYAQSAICISFKYTELDKIGQQLFFNRPQIYASNLPTAIASKNPYLAKVIAREYQKDEKINSNIITLKSFNNVNFVSFAKTAKYGKDLYNKLVAPNLKTGLIVETWRRGSPVPLDCTAQYSVSDVFEVSVVNSSFKFSNDHSKIAFSNDQSVPYVCVGDINRMTTQYIRGGGTICLKNYYIWNQYSKTPKVIDACKKNKDTKKL